MLNPFFSSSHFSVLDKETICKNLYREWLVGNGLGSYSSGTISGILSKRYHGIFVISQMPSLERTLFVSKIEETLEIEGVVYHLGTNKWFGRDDLFPKGYVHLEYFYLDENIPVWIYKCDNIYIEKKIFMPHEKNSVYITYKILSPHHKIPIKIQCNIFVNNRNFHSLANNINIIAKENHNSIDFYSLNHNYLFCIKSNFIQNKIENIIYYNYELQEEKDRGFDYMENHCLGVSLISDFNIENTSEIIISSTNNEPYESSKIVQNHLKDKNQIIIKHWNKEKIYTPDWIQQLLYAVNTFIVKRAHIQNKKAHSIIAGYHWFGDWGRDTMISLPGLCCVTGQMEIAKSILENYARYIDNGMIPNRFSDDGKFLDYNTVDATLWFFEAIYHYYSETKDILFLEKIYPILDNVIDYHIKGTRYQIKCDQKDGLLYAGELGFQLTWMDAKIGDFVVTPRIGKPVEVNALWYNALKNMERFSEDLGMQSKKFNDLSQIVEQGFLNFWNEEEGYCYDVLNSPNGNDKSLRPNQIIALSLNHCPLSQFQKKSIIDICGRYLVSYFGVRSLAKFSAQYKGCYFGSPFERDYSYHQGTSWSWLLGNYAIAYYNVTKNASVAIGFLEPLEKHINEAGIGFISEIFDADAPFLPRGCIAQAWGVAETLRAWKFLSKKL